MLVTAMAFLAIAILVSLVLHNGQAQKVRAAGVALFAVFAFIGCIRAFIVLWKTRNLDPRVPHCICPIRPSEPCRYGMCDVTS